MQALLAASPVRETARGYEAVLVWLRWMAAQARHPMMGDAICDTAIMMPSLSAPADPCHKSVGPAAAQTNSTGLDGTPRPIPE